MTTQSQVFKGPELADNQAQSFYMSQINQNPYSFPAYGGNRYVPPPLSQYSQPYYGQQYPPMMYPNEHFYQQMINLKIDMIISATFAIKTRRKFTASFCRLSSSY